MAVVGSPIRPGAQCAGKAASWASLRLAEMIAIRLYIFVAHKVINMIPIAK
jgi:hypothetical protein